MTLAKAVVTGSIYRAPETRFTQNNVPVSSFVLNIGEKEEMLLRIISKRTALNDIVSALAKDDKVLVEGRLQITTVKSESGNERRIFEIDANTIEPISAISTSGAASSNSSASNDEIVKFPKEEDLADELIGEDEIPF
jgi:single-stranded DNA-binding protein